MIVTETEHFDRTAAGFVSGYIRMKPDAVLGFATGSTTVGLHRELARMHLEEGLDFSQVYSFNLDEYAGIPWEHPKSCRCRMEEQLFRHVNIRRERIEFLNGAAADPEAECVRFARAIDACGGIDLQVLGIGTNGHIAFNEPGTPFDSRLRVVPLAQQTIGDKSAFFGGEELVPRCGITMGLMDVMRCKRNVLLARGADKADIIRRSLRGPVTVDVPASVLQLHPQLTVILDKAAAAGL
nr:glucosamine-6-phosphate deaminase [Paenibacillus hamazuiensis]